jgi:uncharacterized membrane protein YdjX (TVP38/TMEM64 family)
MKYFLRSCLAISLLVLILLVARELVNAPQFADFLKFISDYLPLAATVLVAYRTAAALIPFLPADLLTFIAIPVFGLPVAFLLDLLGGMIGTIAAYQIGKSKGIAIIGFLVGQDAAEKIKMLKVDGKHDILLLVLAKTMYLGLFSSPASYLAGMEHMKFSHLIVGAVLAKILLRLPIFLVGEAFLSQSQPNIMLVLFVVVYSLLGSLFVYKYVNK